MSALILLTSTAPLSSLAKRSSHSCAASLMGGDGAFSAGSSIAGVRFLAALLDISTKRLKYSGSLMLIGRPALAFLSSLGTFASAFFPASAAASAFRLAAASITFLLIALVSILAR